MDAQRSGSEETRLFSLLKLGGDIPALSSQIPLWRSVEYGAGVEGIDDLSST